MKFWKFSTQVLATLLASVTVINASGPTDGDAVADPNSAVVKLTAEKYASFIEENSLILAEFFAPWCGYCKQLGPEFSKAADSLNTSNPDIKLAQIDCDAQKDFCVEHGIRGYPTLKVIKNGVVSDYDGPRAADGIAQYMVKESLPAVSSVTSEEQLDSLFEGQSRPLVIQIYTPDITEQESNATFIEVADLKRKDVDFFAINDAELVSHLNKKVNVNLSKVKTPKYVLIHPEDLQDVREFTGKELTADALTEFITVETVPYFGDINRDTFMMYMGGDLPIAYYFYNDIEQRNEVEPFFTKLGKEYRGKINFVGLDSNLFGRHAEMLSMNPDIVPLFAIQDIKNSKKFGIDQEANPKGPSQKQIAKFLKDYFSGKVEPIVKSEALPTEEEKKAQSVIKFVGHNHAELLKDTSKDVFIKYYAPWCGHCNKLAPVWEELASIYGSNEDNASVLIGKLDHTANDVETPYEIQGYPTLLLYPANGKIDPETGIREAILFEGNRELDAFVDFVKNKGGLGVDGEELKKAKAEAAPEEDADDEVVEGSEEAEEEEVHDEL